MATPSVGSRVRQGIEALLHRPRDPERERAWERRETEVEHERRDAVDSPVGGVRGSQPYDFAQHRHH
ncbi:MAG: hypothetical protein M0T75_02585 [Chloroflexi bacterium]|nr:hypothetical protein [Chloroflexota bacterium]